MWEFWRSKSKGSGSRNGRSRLLSPDRQESAEGEDGQLQPMTDGGSPSRGDSPAREKCSPSPRRRGPTSPEQTHIYFKDLKLPVEDPEVGRAGRLRSAVGFRDASGRRRSNAAFSGPPPSFPQTGPDTRQHQCDAKHPPSKLAI
mmetsp:Transcript_39866/g.101945  ORF Transcript_39866/g.101945 Transcript_39866/m.101945 type:complete len:144 (-) Transcript_39866:316-747(-)